MSSNSQTSAIYIERKFSARLAEKRKIADGRFSESGLTSLGKSEDADMEQAKSDLDSVSDVLKNQREKFKDSKTFLDCLELKPVESQSISKIVCGGNSDTESETKNSDNNIMPIEKHVVAKSTPSSKKFRKKVRKMITRKTDCPQTIETVMDSSVNSDSCNKLLVTEKQYVTENSLKDVEADSKDTNSRHSASDKGEGGKDTSQVYIFRDVNKVAVNSADASENESSASDLFTVVDLNQQGKKRRYDKLMKKLVDSEKKLQINLREVQHDNFEKEDIDLCVEKMKEKLRVREKKKYECLINYMRDQWRVDQKSFQDLLPQKVDTVKANVVKQLGAHPEKLISEKRMRGRPRKMCVSAEQNKESSANKKASASQSKKTKKRKVDASDKAVPVKLPDNLLLNASISPSHYKFEKFRVGIIDRNGAQEVIELNSDTLKGVKSAKGTDCMTAFSNSISDKQRGKHMNEESFHGANIRQDRSSVDIECSQESCGEHRKYEKYFETAPPSPVRREGKTHEDSGQDVPSIYGEFQSSEAWHKSPPTTITLPSISSLEKDYELVSLSPSCPPELGNFHTDHFFVPQSTFDQDGKTSIIIVGPFCVVCDPKPRLLLVSPEERKKGPTMILRKKVHSPSKTPPRDFRIRKDSRWVRLPDKAAPVGAQPGDPAVILHDHDYMTPPEMRDSVKRYCKAVAKHSANAKFIDARVEDITEGEDNYVVTIKGDNVLRQVKNLANPSQAPMHCNKEGMPVVYNLSQIMTPALLKAEEMARREELVSQKTGDYSQVLFPLSAMGDVVMEVLIPPGGTEVTPRSKAKHLQFAEEAEKMDTSVSQSGMAESPGASPEIRFLHYNKTINLDCGTSSEEKDVSNIMLTNNLLETEEDEKYVVVENAAVVDSGSRPGLPCCRMCLRLFPSDYALFTHVRSNHPAYETRDNVYLEELRARSRLACPICCNPSVYLATPLKLRRHLRQNHGIEHYVESCSLCRAEFLDKQELELHMELSHNVFSPGGFVSLMKPPEAGHLIRGQQSLLSDYLSCSRCNIVFTDRASLLSHTLKVHPELNQFNVCRLCDRVFDSGLTLHKHLKKAHEQTHNGALKCPFCPAWLPTMEMASVHRVTLHSGAVPVHCPFCGAGYQSLHPMYNHVRNQHLQTEAHFCPECQASFPTSRSLSEHVRKVHLMTSHIMKGSLDSSDSTTYCCPFCTVSFVRTYDLAIHVVNAHKEHLLPVQCHMCLQSFVSPMVMKMHMSGAHGIDVEDHQQDNGGDASYMHGHYSDSESVTVVLEDVRDDIYSHSKGLEAGTHSRRALVTRHIMDPQDIMETQEAGRYIQDLDEGDTETIVYLNERHEVVNTGDVFSDCSTIEDVQLLNEGSDDFSLHGADYLETLTNDSIAVGADVVADVTMDEMTSGRGVDRTQGARSQDMQGIANQFEIDGVLYELATSHDTPGHHLRGTSDLITIDASDLRVDDRITIDTGDLAQLLRQQAT